MHRPSVANISQNQDETLKFTGNWFFDAGILGFVNLMEEVYGWDLEELQKRLRENEEEIYYGWFPFAYVYHNNKIRNSEIQCNIFISNNLGDNPREIFDNAWKYISNLFSKSTKHRGKTKNRIDLNSSNVYYYFQNFLFFQPSWDKLQQREAFEEILGLKERSSVVLNRVDKTLNKFLPSTKELPNSSYTKNFIRFSSTFDLIYTLCFPLGFIRGLKAQKTSILFYTPNLPFAYKINKTISIRLQRVNKNDVFKVTWEAIFDNIIKEKALWNLQEMYILEYVIGKNQNIFNVDYIGISELQANVIIDDALRRNMNKKIQFRSSGHKRGNAKAYFWIMEEFLKGKPLLPFVMNHIYLKAIGDDNVNRDFSKTASIASLAIDSNLKPIQKNSRLFSQDFFGEYRYLVNDIKKTQIYMHIAQNATKDIFSSENKDKRRSYSIELLSDVRSNNRNAFLTKWGKLLNRDSQKNAKQKKRLITTYVRQNVINNDMSWREYALPVVMGMLL